MITVRAKKKSFLILILFIVFIPSAKAETPLENGLHREGTFEEALPLIFEYEGGYSNDPGDSGGPTKFGITNSEYQVYLRLKKRAPRFVALITKTEAEDIYRQNYWLASRCYILKRRLAVSCFDWQVNSGRGAATFQFLFHLPQRDFIDHNTLKFINLWGALNRGEDVLLQKYFARRDYLYRLWGQGNQAVFLQGWLRRSRTLREYLGVKP